MAQAAKRPYLPELEIARAFGIMAVVMIHATSAVIGGYDHLSTLYPFYVFLNTFPKFAVPVFVFLSGFVLFYNYYDKPFTLKTFGDFYKKRIFKTLIPFLVFSFLYYGLTRIATYGFTDIGTFLGYFTTKKFFDTLIIGKTYTHLYFVVIILQFYVLAPFLLYAVKRFKSLGIHFLWIGLLIQWLFIFKIAPDLMLHNRGSYSFTYMLYFAAGAFLGIYYMKLVDWIKISMQNATPPKITAWIFLWALFISTSVIEVNTYYYLRLHNKLNIDSNLLELIDEIRCVTAGIVLIQLAYWVYAKWNARAVKALLHLGAVSFGIYLIHPAILYLYRQSDASGKPLLYHVWVAGGFLVALFIPWLIVTISAKFKWHWILFGPLPTKKKPAAAKEQSLNAQA